MSVDDISADEDDYDAPRQETFEMMRQRVEAAAVDHNDGKFLSTMEWSMVFAKVPTIVVNGKSKRC